MLDAVLDVYSIPTPSLALRVEDPLHTYGRDGDGEEQLLAQHRRAGVGKRLGTIDQ